MAKNWRLGYVKRLPAAGRPASCRRDTGMVNTMSKKRIKHLGKKKKERDPDLSAEQVLQLMEEEDRPLLSREIIRHLGLRDELKQRTRALLKDLEDEGKIVRIRGNRYGLPLKMNLVVGKVKCHPDGYGFVIPEAEGEEDIFVSPKNLKEAMHGDRVVARGESIRRRGKEGKVIRILERAFRKVVGKFMKAKHYSYLIPEDERILQEIYIPDGEP